MTSTTQPQLSGDPAAKHYTIVRKTNYLDRMFYLKPRLGIQSNIIVSARYGHQSSTSDAAAAVLTKPAIYEALRAVIAKFPELGLIGVPQRDASTSPSSPKHFLATALLDAIDLDKCVEFLNDEETVDASLLTKLHNEWYWIEDEPRPREPWWKVIVVGKREVAFVFHHLVCDGGFGRRFHEELLAGLNSTGPESSLPISTSQVVRLGDADRVKLDPELEAFILSKASILGSLGFFLVLFMIKILSPSWLLFSDHPKAPQFPTASIFSTAREGQRTITRVHTHRISKESMARILSACRSQGTTFSPLLSVMILSTLAMDFYPQAKFGLSFFAVDTRGILPYAERTSQERGIPLVASSGGADFAWLSRYRRPFHQTSSSNNKKTDEAEEVDTDAVWKLVKDYGATIQKSRVGSPPPIILDQWRANASGPHLEDTLYKTLPGVGLATSSAVMVSNIGAGSGSGSGQGIGPWAIEDMQFSAGAVNNRVFFHGICFNVCGIKGGETVINAVTEDGIVAPDVAKEVVDATMRRLEALL